MGFGKKKGGAHAAPANVKTKQKKRPLTAKEKKRRIAIVVLAVIAALLCVSAAVMAFFQRPEIPTAPIGGDEEIELEGPKLSGDRKDDFFTFLVIGRDTGGGGNTDTILFLSIS